MAALYGRLRSATDLSRLVRRRIVLLLPIAASLAAVGWLVAESRSGHGTPPSRMAPGEAAPGERAPEPIHWRRSRSVGFPWQGRLLNGVQLPREGRDFFTWDPVLKRTPNRGWRRHGHDRLLRTVLRILRAHRAAFPGASRVGLGDLSRTRGGDFGPRFGSLGHASHQNGLDVDVYYPRRDRLEWRANRVKQVDLERAQDLVDRFVRAEARYVFVGPSLELNGPKGVVQKLPRHDDHLHVRFPPDPGDARRARAPGEKGGR